MNEIERFLKDNMTHYDNGYFTFKRFDLKKLIKLVENKQMYHCMNAIDWDNGELKGSELVSQKIDWEKI